MTDTIETIGKSVIHHGKNNDRIYLMKLFEEDYPEIVSKLNSIASNHSYSKIFAKVPKSMGDAFISNGYIIEASVPNFYNGKDTGLFLGKFLNQDREQCENKNEIDSIIKLAKQKSTSGKKYMLQDNLNYRICNKEDAEEMAVLYSKVFKSYPFPIDNPDYIKETMDEDVVYFAIEEDNRIIALSSSEIYPEYESVEMTDFATLPDSRGGGYAKFLLQQMDIEMQQRGLKTAYTIARSVSAGMNITFARNGYTFGGTLVNNTHISGQFESMNIWYKSLNA